MQLLRLPEVIAMTTLSSTTIYDMMAAREFPRPIRVGTRAVRWFQHEVIEFIASRPRGGSQRFGE